MNAYKKMYYNVHFANALLNAYGYSVVVEQRHYNNTRKRYVITHDTRIYTHIYYTLADVFVFITAIYSANGNYGRIAEYVEQF